MGAWLSLAVILAGRDLSGISALGLISGMFQDRAWNARLAGVVGAAHTWSSTLDRDLTPYFHYCGNGANVGRPEDPWFVRGDRLFRPGNERVCRQLTDNRVQVIPADATNDGGMHRWSAWRPQITDFLRSFVESWTVARRR